LGELAGARDRGRVGERSRGPKGPVWGLNWRIGAAGVGAPRHRRAASAWSAPPASSRPGQQGGGTARLPWSREARLGRWRLGKNNRGHEVAAAGAYSTSTACARESRPRPFCRRRKGAPSLRQDARYLDPVRRTRAALAGARAGESPTDWRTERGAYGRHGSLDVSGRGLWVCVTRWEGVHRGADTKASRAWRGPGAGRRAARWVQCVGLAVFDHIFL
jgi:hypothetical protein